MFSARGPNLLPIDDVMIALAHGRRAQSQRIGTRCRLGHAEGLQSILTGRNAGQPTLLLGVAPVPQQGAHRVHLGVTGGAIAAGGMDFLHDDGGFVQREAAGRRRFQG